MKFGIKRFNGVFNKGGDVNKLFTKGQVGDQKLFGKGSIAVNQVGKLSDDLASAGKGLSTAGAVSNAVGNVAMLGGALTGQPEIVAGGLALKGAGAGLNALGKVSTGTSAVTNQNNNSIEKVKGAGNAAQGAITFV